MLTILVRDLHSPLRTVVGSFVASDDYVISSELYKYAEDNHYSLQTIYPAEMPDENIEAAIRKVMG